MGTLNGEKVAVFYTRFTEAHIEGIRILAFFVRIFGYAAKPIGEKLVNKGGELLIALEEFYVSGTEWPQLEGELERAREQAEKIRLLL